MAAAGSRKARLRRVMVVLLQVAVTPKGSTTVRRQPAGFHDASIGCTSPPLLVARTFSSCEPGSSFTGTVHSRTEYLPRSLSSFAGIQLLPPSLETATSLLPLPPSNAMPFSVVVTRFSFAPSLMLVTKERTVKRLIGMVDFGAVPGSTQWQSLSGMR